MDPVAAAAVLRHLSQSPEAPAVARLVLAYHALAAPLGPGAGGDPLTPGQAGDWKRLLLRGLRELGLVVLAEKRYSGGVAAILYSPGAEQLPFLLVDLPLAADPRDECLERVAPYWGRLPVPLAWREPGPLERPRYEHLARLMEPSGWRPEPRLKRYVELFPRLARGLRELAERLRRGVEEPGPVSAQLNRRSAEVARRLLAAAGLP